ncbi:MAG: molybdopterin-guanine dinucleotide biosynthesis protein MobB, partial [Afipia sp.]|nr:molybdopterin-guanine dinucleotide biosynthesis protein MobB [Afipia sp.]
VVEGFKADSHPKIEVHRVANGRPLMFSQDSAIVGLVSDIDVETPLPVAHIDDIAAVARLMKTAAVRIEDVLAREAAST